MSPTGPKSQYIKVANEDGYVYKAREGFSRLETDIKGWLDKESFFKVEKIKSVSVTGSTPEESWKISRETEAGELKLDASRPWLMVHAGSGGSANNLSIEQYARLIIKLNQACPELQCILTAGPGEERVAEQLAAELLAHGGNGWIYRSDEGLPTFCQVMANAALFVAGSTGPLHIAAALDVPTVGFFPAHRSATPLRWRPLNSEGRHLAFSPPEDSDHPDDMSQLDPKTMAAAIVHWASPFWRR